MPADVVDLTAHRQAQEAQQAAEQAFWKALTQHANPRVRVLASIAIEEAKAAMGVKGQLDATRDLRDRAALSQRLAVRNVRFESLRDGAVALARVTDAALAQQQQAQKKPPEGA